MVANFINNLVDATKKLGFPLLVYELNSEKMYNIVAGKSDIIDVPESIAPFLADENIYCHYFSRGKDVIVIYFIRFKNKSGNYVVVINDTKQRLRLNRFLFLIFSEFNRLNISNKTLNDEIEELSGKYDTLNEKYNSALAEATQSKSESQDDFFVSDNEQEDLLVELLKEEKEDYAKRLAQLSEEYESLQKKYSENESLVKQITAEKEELIAEKSEQIAEKEELIAEKEEKIKELEEKIQVLATTLEDGEDIIKKQLENDSAQRKVISDMEFMITGLNDKVEEMTATLKDNEALIKEQDEKVSKQEQLIDDFNVKVVTLSDSLATAESKHTDIQNEYSALQKELNEAKEKIDTLIKDAELRAEKDSLELNYANEDASTFALQLGLTKNELSEKEESISTLQKELDSKLKLIAELEKNVVTEEERLLALREINDYKQKIDLLTNEKNGLEVSLMQKEERLKELQQKERALESVVAENSIRLEKLNAELSQIKDETAAKIAEFERKIDKQAEVIKDSEGSKVLLGERDSKIDQLNTEIDKLKLSVEEYQEKIFTLNNDISERDQRIENVMQSYMDLQNILNEHKKAQEQLHQKNISEQELNAMLKRSRDKYTDLINGLTQPLFSLNNERLLVTLNKELLNFANCSKHIDMIGKPCYKTIYKFDNPCTWCKHDEVMADGIPATVSASYNTPDKEISLEVTFFPIMNHDGIIVEVGEILTDKTEQTELATSLNKFKEQLKKFKKARIEDMNEINDVKKVYQDLSVEHEQLMEKNNKMQKVVERLVSEDKARALLTARTELMEVKNKLIRSTEMIKNYKYQLEEQQIRYSDLNRRTFLQMERLMNIVKNKSTIRTEESTMVLGFLTREVEQIKKYYMSTDKSDIPSTNKEKPSEAGLDNKDRQPAIRDADTL